MFQIQGRDPLIDVAVALEKRARSDDYFVKRNLYPNVDFYSGKRNWAKMHFREAEAKRLHICVATLRHRLALANEQIILQGLSAGNFLSQRAACLGRS